MSHGLEARLEAVGSRAGESHQHDPQPWKIREPCPCGITEQLKAQASGWERLKYKFWLFCCLLSVVTIALSSLSVKWGRTYLLPKAISGNREANVADMQITAGARYVNVHVWSSPPMSQDDPADKNM